MAKFVKGQSGNPSGKKKGTVATAQKYLQKKYGREGRKVFDALHDLAFDTTLHPRERLAALKELRAVGWSEQVAEIPTAPKLFVINKLPSLKPAGSEPDSTEEPK